MIWAAIWGNQQWNTFLLERDWESKKHSYSVNSYIYVLEENLEGIYKPGMIFMQDNAKIHTAGKTTKWFENHGIVLMDFPTYSPDLNPIEQLWFELKQLVNVLDPQLKTVKAGEDELRERLTAAVERAWLLISPERIRGLVESMDTRIKRCNRS